VPGFQSSPVPKDGCNEYACGAKSGSRRNCFNPHPSRRTGATGTRTVLSKHWMFQSSPVPKDGCNVTGVRIDTILRTGFNPHPSRRTGATLLPVVGISRTVVSILTRPEGRVQRTRPASRGDGWCNHEVSILTRPEGRVQLVARGAMLFGGQRFQSSPVPKDGCNWHSWGRRPDVATDLTFQSSPVPKDGCNVAMAASTARARSAFQSSPVPKDGCNRESSRLAEGQSSSPSGFNPHPSRRTGATGATTPAIRVPYHRFNPHPSRRTGATSAARLYVWLGPSFNPHPSRRTGATWSALDLRRCERFNPHPSRRTGATYTYGQ
jgi:hypothetical protein